MSDQKESAFPGFAGFQPAGMFDKMWDMMRLAPFFGGAAGSGGLPPSLSSMSDMMAPLSSVEELDKRITDLRAVEQWLKLNLGMLQSAIQALEVQRATLATLRAFGAFAKTSMEAAAADAGTASRATKEAPGGAAAKPWPFADLTASAAPDPEPPAPEPAARSEPSGPAAAEGSAAEQAAADAGFDPASWWNLLQSQFNQLAGFAMSQSAAVAEAASAAQAHAEADAAPARKPAAKRTSSPKGTSSGAARSKTEAAPKASTSASAARSADGGAAPRAPRKTTAKRP